MTLQRQSNESAGEDAAPVPAEAAKPPLCFIGESEIRLWSLTAVERLRRQFAREMSVQEIQIDEAARRNGPVIFIRADAVLDQPLIPVLAKQHGLVIMGGHRQVDPARCPSRRPAR